MTSVNTGLSVRQGQFPDPIPGIIPFGTVTLFGGAPGAGKTTMLLDWCARWQDGRTIWGKKTNKPNGIYYLAADRKWESYTRLMESLKLPDLQLHALSVADLYAEDIDLRSLLKDAKHGHEALLYCIKKMQIPKGALLIIEPMALFIQGDLNKMRDVIISLLRLGALTRELGITIIATMHFGKQRQEGYVRHQDKIAGSTAFAGYSDTQVFLVPPDGPKDPWYLLGWNPRDQEGEEFKVARGETGLFIPFEPPEMSDTELRILSLFPELDPITRADIFTRADEAGTPVTARTLDRSLKALVTLGRVIRVEQGTYRRALVQ